MSSSSSEAGFIGPEGTKVCILTRWNLAAVHQLDVAASEYKRQA